LAKLAKQAPAGEQWLHEIMIDGYRTGARVGGGSVIMLTRTGLDWTKRFLPIAWALAELPVCSAYFDGEIAVLGEDGVPSFAALQDALSRGASNRQEFVIGGWLKSDAAGRELRSLLVGYREGGQRDGKLIFAGKVGTGFTERLGLDLARRLAGLTRPDNPFAGVPADYQKGAIWVEPRLVAQVEFKTWTADRLLRAASFQGLREDKRATEVRLEHTMTKGSTVRSS
jgi:ATP-dependent DNA ligase